MFYAALTSFKTMPVSEGWYTEYAWLINNGQLPYRDFEYLFFPLYMFLMAGFTKIFGYGIFALRVLGVLVYGGIGAALYCIFSKLFKNFTGMVAAVITAIFLQSEVAQLYYDYIRFHDLFAYITTFHLLKLTLDANNAPSSQKNLLTANGAFTCYVVPSLSALTSLAGLITTPFSQNPLKALLFLVLLAISLFVLAVSIFRFVLKKQPLKSFGISSASILCGIFAAAECLVKQSNGTLMIVMIMVYMIFCAIALRNRQFYKSFFGFMAGVVFMFTLLGIYLISTGSLNDFIRCCFSNALSAKGGLTTTLFRWIPGSWRAALTGNNMIIVALTMYLGITLLGRNSKKELKHSGLLMILIAGAALAAFEWFFYEVENAAIRFAPKYNGNMVGYIFFPCAIFFFVYGFYLVWCWIKNKQPDGIWCEFFPIFPVLGVIFVQGYGAGMSGGLGTSQVVLALGLITGLCLSAALRTNAKLLLSWIMISVVFLMGTCISRKTMQSYDWWGLLQNRISEHTETADVPLLEGIKMRPMDKQCYETVYTDVVSNTEEGDEIFVFPHAPIFYTITDRHSSTYSKVQWFDVSSVDSITRDIQTLRDNVPKMIVHVQLPEWVYQGHESGFQTFQTRQMNDFLLYELIPAHGYQLLNQADIGNGFVVSTYLLPDTAVE